MKSFKLLILFIFFGFSACQTKNNSVSKSTITFIKSQHKNRHNAPFSEAVEVNGLLFLTGQVGKDHSMGTVVEGGIEAETRQVLTNIKEVLEANGSDLNHVVKCTVILSDIRDFSAMNEVYRTFFVENKPARTTFAADLVPSYKIEIEVVAAKK